MKLDPLGQLTRTHTCGELRAADAGKTVLVMGWVHRRRDLGQLIFLDLRDRDGLTQVVCNKEKNPEAHARADECRPEYVVAVEGAVVQREKGNPNLATGEVEVIASRVYILNDARTPPFQVEDEINVSEETRLRHRFLPSRLVLSCRFGQMVRRHHRVKRPRVRLHQFGQPRPETVGLFVRRGGCFRGVPLGEARHHHHERRALRRGQSGGAPAARRGIRGRQAGQELVDCALLEAHASITPVRPE